MAFTKEANAKNYANILTFLTTGAIISIVAKVHGIPGALKVGKSLEPTSSLLNSKHGFE